MTHASRSATQALVVLSLAATALCAVPLFASRPYLVNDTVATRLRQDDGAGGKVRLEHVPLIDGDSVTLELERFEVWEPDANVIVHEADGKHTHVLPRPDTRYYKGHVAGEADSALAISVAPDGSIDGTIFVRDRVFSFGSGVRQVGNPKGPRDDSAVGRRGQAPLLVREIDPVEDLVARPGARNWHCDVDEIALKSVHEAVAAAAAARGSRAAAIAPNGTPSTGVSYAIKVALETDGELRAAFTSDAALQNYLGNLIMQVSVIYQRDLKTSVTIGTASIWQSPLSDPWAITPAWSVADAMSELANWWHGHNTSVSRSAVVFVSGKPFFAGGAWQDSLCQSDFYCGPDGSQCGSPAFQSSYAGAYAFCGSTVVSTSIPDPTLTQNGVQYGLPANNYWMLLEVAHELGHLANGPHTHCVGLSAAQQASYGVTRSYVDQCFNGEPGCYSNPSTSVPPEKGTIMSFCHNMVVGGYPQSRYAFLKPGEPSELLWPFFQDGLNHGTSNVDATITVGSNLTCGPGQTASVPAGAASYVWSITGGTIDSGGTSNQVSFTPAAASITLSVRVGNANGCTVINTRIATTQCGSATPPAPTALSATASTMTSVLLSWGASAGAGSYDVYRSSSLPTFTKIGSSGTNGYTDSLVSGNTAYLYKVRAVNGAGSSPDSNIDLATTVLFADASLTTGGTPIRAVHVNELRTAVGAVRTLAGLGLYPFTDPGALASWAAVKRIHVVDLRAALDQARSALGLYATSYTDPTITVGVTKPRPQHVYDLRDGTR
jgi:hypothetical protein